MEVHVKRVMLIAALMAAGTAYAAKPVQKTWALEPTSFLGLSFNSSSILSLPECKPGLYGFQQEQLCREKPYDSYYAIEGKPKIGLAYNYDVIAKVAGSQVESFLLSGNTKDFDKAVAIFTEKYGKPTSTSAPEVKTKAGASFANDTLVWDGSRVRITLERLSNDINTFSAAIQNKVAMESSLKADREKIKAGASNL